MESLLVANRGEIAVRVIRSAQELGLRTIAVYSELDRDSLHVRLADEAWNIGPAPAAESYLNAGRILAVAAEAGAAAVHPGYGFLSENADFAQAVQDAGLAWVGPPPDAIRAMGDKITSRRTVEQAGVDAVPGTTEPLTDAGAIREVAARYGYPVAIKAAHGGGGRGLRVVRSDDELADGFEGAAREAEAYFGSPAVYVEKYLARPRHIEAQILCEADGRGWFLGERDCSMQRRHQKLVEESPAPGLSETQRKAIGDAALAVAESCGYRNAGTVEFLMDEDGSLYFLEMNTRLQVEHTVTEMVTGIDLVREQLHIAAGRPVSFDRVERLGHAIEFRINAEDPAAGFLPTPGRIVDYREPAGFGIRVDSWVAPETTVTQYYDNLMAKLVVWGRTRDEAIQRARRALREYVITGVASTIPAHLAVLEHPGFLEGTQHTKTLESEVVVGKGASRLAATLPEEEAQTRRAMTVEVGGRRYEVTYWAPETPLPAADRRPAARRRPPKLDRAGPTAGEDAGIVTAPMQGTIVKVSAKAGDRMEQDDPICVLEAMKMENEVRAPAAGELVELRVRPGDTVTPGQVLAIIR